MFSHPPEKPTAFAIIGTGNIAQFHADAIALVPTAQLIAVHSRREAQGFDFAAKNGCEYYGDYAALLAREDVEVVCITTPICTHAELGIRAARAGKHVLCEKPLGITPQKVDALVAACQNNGVRLGGMFQARFGKTALALKKAVDGGRFGTICWASAYVPWFRSQAYYYSDDWREAWHLDGTGVLMQQSVHAIDMLLSLMGKVKSVSAKCGNVLHKNLEVEDTAMAWLEFETGALGVIQGTTCAFPGEPRRLEIKGSRGSVTLLDDRPVLWKFDEETPEDAPIHEEIKNLQWGGAFSSSAISLEGHRAQIEDFANAIKENRQPIIPGEEGRRVVELICAIYQSNLEGRVLTL